jgi:hypothetical protein
MKANELRIGNLVSPPVGCEYHFGEITALNLDTYDCELVDNNYEEYVSLSQFGKIRDLEPIPLTEEWLLKFGFEKVITDTEDAYGIDYNLEVADICYISYSDDFSCAIYGSEYASKNSIGAVPNWNSIKYVHGLQNLYFSLTGEELTIGGQDEK